MKNIDISQFVKNPSSRPAVYLRKNEEKEKVPTLKREYEYINTKEFAELVGLTNTAVQNLCRSGSLDGAFQIGRSWRIPVLKKFLDDGQSKS